VHSTAYGSQLSLPYCTKKYKKKHKGKATENKEPDMLKRNGKRSQKFIESVLKDDKTRKKTCNSN